MAIHVFVQNQPFGFRPNISFFTQIQKKVIWFSPNEILFILGKRKKKHFNYDCPLMLYYIKKKTKCIQL